MADDEDLQVDEGSGESEVGRPPPAQAEGRLPAEDPAPAQEAPAPQPPGQRSGIMPQSLTDEGAAERLGELLQGVPGPWAAQLPQPPRQVPAPAPATVDPFVALLCNSLSSLEAEQRRELGAAWQCPAPAHALPWDGRLDAAATAPLGGGTRKRPIAPAARAPAPPCKRRALTDRDRRSLAERGLSRLTSEEHAEYLALVQQGATDTPRLRELRRWVTEEQRSWRTTERLRICQPEDGLEGAQQQNHLWLLPRVAGHAHALLQAAVQRVRALPQLCLPVGEGAEFDFHADGTPQDQGLLERFHQAAAHTRLSHKERLAELGEVPLWTRCGVSPQHQLDPGAESPLRFPPGVLRGELPPPTPPSGLSPGALEFPAARKGGPVAGGTTPRRSATKAAATQKGTSEPQRGQHSTWRRAAATPCVSADCVAAHLAAQRQCGAVMTPSVLAAIARTAAGDERGWSVPVTARTVGGRRVLFFDRPLPTAQWTPRRANTAYYKARVLSDGVCGTASSNQRSLRCGQGASWDPVGDAAEQVITPCEDPDGFSNWAYDVLDIGGSSALLRSRTHAVDKSTGASVVVRARMEYNKKDMRRAQDLTCIDDERVLQLEALPVAELAALWAALAARPPGATAHVARVVAYTSTVVAWESFDMDRAVTALAEAMPTKRRLGAGSVTGFAAALLAFAAGSAAEDGQYLLTHRRGQQKIVLERLTTADGAKAAGGGQRELSLIIPDLLHINSKRDVPWNDYIPTGYWRHPEQAPQTFPAASRYNAGRSKLLEAGLLEGDAAKEPLEYENVSRFYVSEGGGRCTEYAAGAGA
eukprot:TRINITY_DN10262_c0_g1_i1.p1 TRINITY_DN10262_c0_g1~~TRINITY_DN10262_c0_g1_i1.p1  ORF type:complete len:839 (+),score=185.12 TRINITY_DN10262_c0_g1_i1:74-2518(+)